MDISHLLPDTVDVAPRTGTDDNGDPSYGSVTTIDARIEQERELTEEVGDERDSKEVFITNGTIADDYVVWLPSQNSGTPSDGQRVDTIERADPLSGGNEVKRVVLK